MEPEIVSSKQQIKEVTFSDTPFPFLVKELKELIFHQYQLINKQFIEPDCYFKTGESHSYLEQSLPVEEFPHQRYGLIKFNKGLPGERIKKLGFNKKYLTYYLNEDDVNDSSLPLISFKCDHKPYNTEYLPVPSKILVNRDGFVALNVPPLKNNGIEQFYLVNVDQKVKQSQLNYLWNFFFRKEHQIPLKKEEFLATTISPCKQMVVSMPRNAEKRHTIFLYTLTNKSWNRKEISFDPDHIVRSVCWGPSNSILVYLLKSKSLALFELANEWPVDSFLHIYDTEAGNFHDEINLHEWINNTVDGNVFFNKAIEYYQTMLNMKEPNTDNVDFGIVSAGNRTTPLINRLEYLYQTNRFVEIYFSVEILFGQKFTVQDFISVFPNYVFYDFQAKRLLSISLPISQNFIKHKPVIVKSYDDLKKMVFFFLDNPGILLLINKAYSWLNDPGRPRKEANEIITQLHNKNIINNHRAALWAATVGKDYKNNYFKKIHEWLKAKQRLPNSLITH
jgi:hypothetical protein